MRPRKIRPIVICVFAQKDRLFVTEGYDSYRKERFFRPLGGAIEFGEHSRQSIIPEIRDETGAEIRDSTYVGLIENVFTYDGQPGHETVLVYGADFVDPRLYTLESVKCNDNGDWLAAMWKPIDDFRSGKAILYPEGLPGVLARKSA